MVGSRTDSLNEAVDLSLLEALRFCWRVVRANSFSFLR